jgi:protein arginine kinase activator
MQCEACQKNAATVHLTDVSNNTKREVHLCEACAKKQGVTIKSYLNKPSGYPELLTQLVHSQSEEIGEEKDLTCPRCRITYRKFRSTGKFGCAHDYVVFKKGLLNLLEKIHGKVEHRGKVPLRASDEIAKQKELRSLRADLEKAVREEAYERAAQIRDRIYSLEGRGAET